ncbi:single-stranded DNA-binding protein [Bifidobacterium moukalabense DSM 27321]|uniref:Single-stranded DNA-binding protein n=2 Tax=Bifidobacterium moukalabense TaxID=1333651 RepID=W4N9D7_9BIFI|nr:single-stranded DNA-binding protein [Bifidobacterium moukalabense]ETY71713.1 single-stranded DNA-binding protein [Bifidobacterium moukalabense DSM 27321]
MAGETILTIIGNLTGEPEMRTTSNGGTVCNFSIAATPRTFNRQSNQWEDGDALFMRCTAWRDLAAHCAQSLHKGMRVIAQGRLQQRTYQAKDGTNRTVVELQVDEIGPSLKYATAQVARIQHANGGGQNMAQAPAQQPVAGGWGAPADPWGAPSGEDEF